MKNPIKPSVYSFRAKPLQGCQKQVQTYLFRLLDNFLISNIFIGFWTLSNKMLNRNENKI